MDSARILWVPRVSRALAFAAVIGALLGAHVPEVAAEVGRGHTTGIQAAILPLEVQGDLATSDRDALRLQLAEGLERGAFTVVPSSLVLEALSGRPMSCDTRRCFEKVAAATEATHVVRTILEVMDRDYSVTVELIDGSDGTVLVAREESCEICGVADVGALLSTAAAALKTKLDALALGPSTLVLQSNPSGATVTLDGKVIGVAPLKMPVDPGKHRLRVSREGFIAIEREVTFVEGVEETIDFELDRVPSRLPGRSWGIASLGVGIAALGTGLVLTGLHGRAYGSACNVQDGTLDAFGECKYLWDTKWLGAGLGMGGAALTALGVAVMLTTTSVSAKTQVRVGPGSLSVRGRF